MFKKKVGTYLWQARLHIDEKNGFSLSQLYIIIISAGMNVSVCNL